MHGDAPGRWSLDHDRLFPADPSTRAIARELYEVVADKPILSLHGHVDPAILLGNRRFENPAELLVQHDHYVTRLMHAAGVPLNALGIPALDGSLPVATPQEVWRRFCSLWEKFDGTASSYWLHDILVGQFGIDEVPEIGNADRLYNKIDRRLATAEFRPRALFERFRIEVLATTDDPMSDLSVHAALTDDPAFHGRVVPTFRPDAYLDSAAPGWPERVATLAKWNGTPEGSYRGYLESLAGRRQFFVQHGAISADHGVRQPLAVDLDEEDAKRLFDRALRGRLTDREQRVFAGHMLMQMARLSIADGLVMTVHPGVFRNHHDPTFQTFGANVGCDIPVRTEYVQALRPLLGRYGNDPDFHLVLFSVDEASYSREIAPLAGFYPSVYIGAPWWFLDAPDAALRFRSAVTETAGFYRSAGFVDDTRAFLSIPTRHDMARRLDAAFLARLVIEGRLGLAAAKRIAADQVDALPRHAFKL